MKYLRVFKTVDQYREYCKSNDVWLPRVSYVVESYIDTDGTTNIGLNEPADFQNASEGLTWDKFLDSSVAWDTTIMERTKGFVDWRILKTEFMRVANGGICYLTDTTNVLAPGTPSEDASAWLEEISYDSSTDTHYMRLCIRTKSEADSTVCYINNEIDNDTSTLTPMYVEKVHAYPFDYES